MKKAAYLLVAIPILAFAACQQAEPVANDSGSAANLPDPVVTNVSDPSGAPPPPNATTPPALDTDGDEAPAAAIPAALHGRWGLTPGDCTSTRGDSKGLLTITAERLSFYESRAVPTGNVQSAADRFSADFDFTGEGMEWTKYQTLERKGDRLTRTESNPMATFTYARCD